MISLQFSYQLKEQCMSFAMAYSLFFWIAGTARLIEKFNPTPQNFGFSLWPTFLILDNNMLIPSNI